MLMIGWIQNSDLVMYLNNEYLTSKLKEGKGELGPARYLPFLFGSHETKASSRNWPTLEREENSNRCPWIWDGEQEGLFGEAWWSAQRRSAVYQLCLPQARPTSSRVTSRDLWTPGKVRLRVTTWLDPLKIKLVI